jgi:hypothetical protein
VRREPGRDRGEVREQITLEEILDVASFQLRAKMYKQFPGIVTKGGSSVVDVQPAVHDVRYDVLLGTRVSEPWDPITAVPVGWLKFGPFALVGHLEVGDKVTLMSYDLDPSVHRGSGRAENPADVSRHAGAYWLALPSDITFAGALADPGSGKMLLGAPGGQQVAIDVAAATVSLGKGPTDAMALASIADTFVNTILEWGKVPPVLPDDGLLTLKTALASWASTMTPPYTSTASKTVKIAP